MKSTLSKVASPLFALAMLFAFTAVLSAADSTAKPAEEKPACCRDGKGGEGSSGAHCTRPGQSGDAKACCAEHGKKAGDANGCCEDCCHDSCDRPAGKGTAPKG